MDHQDLAEYTRKQLRAARMARGLSQRELAARSNVCASTIARLETTGHTQAANLPSLTTLRCLADGLGMRLRVEFIDAGSG